MLKSMITLIMYFMVSIAALTRNLVRNSSAQKCIPCCTLKMKEVLFARPCDCNLTRLRVGLFMRPNWVVFPAHLRTKTNPVSETSCFLFSRIPDDERSSKPSNSENYSHPTIQVQNTFAPLLLVNYTAKKTAFLYEDNLHLLSLAVVSTVLLIKWAICGESSICSMIPHSVRMRATDSVQCSSSPVVLFTASMDKNSSTTSNS
jgi:hypothetical protein